MEAPAKKGNPASTMAHASWGVILFYVLFGSAIRMAGLPIVADLLGALCIVVALALALAALVGIKRHGRRGVLVPAIVGLVLSLLLGTIAVTNFMAGLERGKARRDAAAAPAKQDATSAVERMAMRPAPVTGP